MAPPEPAPKLFIVDAFSSAPFSGNQAAVALVPPSAQLSDEQRQAIAAEMNLAETAFVEPPASSGAVEPFRDLAEFGLRWFTPTTEVPLCGHATLAAAAALYAEAGNTAPTVAFATRSSGVLRVSRAAAAPPALAGNARGPGGGGGGPARGAPLWLEMSLPLADPVDPLPAVCSSAEAPLVKACAGDLQVAELRYTAAGGLNYLVIALAEGTTRAQLEGIAPDWEAMAGAAAREDGISGVIVTAAGAGQPGGFDCLSRFFGPWLGVPEDHVTGSAHAVLGPYWASRLGRTELTARQCSRRGGEMCMRVDVAGRAVVLVGSAVVVMRGELAAY